MILFGHVSTSGACRGNDAVDNCTETQGVGSTVVLDEEKNFASRAQHGWLVDNGPRMHEVEVGLVGEVDEVPQGVLERRGGGGAVGIPCTQRGDPTPNTSPYSEAQVAPAKKRQLAQVPIRD